jgi:Domain of unknown function (DUF5665)
MNNFKNEQTRAAQRDLLEQLFDDHYNNRWAVYKMNFVRGLFFGVGSFLGATVVVGAAIGVLSLFTDLPVVGGALQNTRQTIEKQQQN